MITREDFENLVKYLELTGKLKNKINIENKYKEFLERRENSDYINELDFGDARYDAEMDLVDEVVLE